MKVLMINGSPHSAGSTYTALHQMELVFAEQGMETEIVQVGQLDVRGCTACGYCKRHGKCVFNDVVNELAEKLAGSDALVVGTPVYYASANATTTAVLDRLFYSTKGDIRRFKPACCVASARRGGLSATFNQINKYFTISEMPVVSATYWNDIHGNDAAQASQDAEGLHTMRALARNMAFLMQCIALGKEQYGLPAAEKKVAMNFIR